MNEKEKKKVSNLNFVICLCYEQDLQNFPFANVQYKLFKKKEIGEKNLKILNVNPVIWNEDWIRAGILEIVQN